MYAQKSCGGDLMDGDDVERAVINRRGSGVPRHGRTDSEKMTVNGEQR